MYSSCSNFRRSSSLKTEGEGDQKKNSEAAGMREKESKPLAASEEREQREINGEIDQESSKETPDSSVEIGHVRRPHSPEHQSSAAIEDGVEASEAN